MEYVKLHIEGEVAKVILDRPKSLNALSNQVYEEIIACLEEIEPNDQVKVVILTGNGRAFAAGADIAQMVDYDAIQARHLGTLCHRTAFLLENMRQVTIAAVNGFALGGGCELTLACDIRIASEKAKFALPEVKLGILPGGGGTQRLARLIGIGRTKELIFTGDQIDAQEAYRMGLANHVVAPEELMPTCEALAKKIASRASFAVSMAKRSINTGADTDMANGSQRETDILGLLFATHDQKEGMLAFLEGREPNFSDF